MAAQRIARRSSRPGADEVVRLMGQVPIFAGCSRRELGRIAATAEAREVPAGHALTREGEPGREFAVIVAGRVEVRRKGRKLRELGPGDWLGEIALLTGGPRTATATTVEPTRVLLIRGGMFRALVERTPSIAYKVLERVARLVPGEPC
jgi:CRP/FNR family transcriptional regulator, cyclic AMP receptor protein